MCDPRALMSKADWDGVPISQVLRDLRIAAGQTQREVAIGVGTDSRRIAAWERGENEPGPEYVERLENYWKLPAGSLAKLIRGKPPVAVHQDEVMDAILEALARLEKAVLRLARDFERSQRR